MLASDPTYSRVEYSHLFIQSKSKLMIIIIKAAKHKKLINVANNASAKSFWFASDPPFVEYH